MRIPAPKDVRMPVRQLEITLAVSVFHVEGTADVNPEQMFDRILNALVPHPDSVIATELAGESVTVLANGVEELEND